MSTLNRKQAQKRKSTQDRLPTKRRKPNDKVDLLLMKRAAVWLPFEFP